MKTYAATINATEYPAHLKHKIIFETFEQLQSSEAMLLINDHDPVPLRFQFQSTHPEGFTWEYIEQGPSISRSKSASYRMDATKRAQAYRIGCEAPCLSRINV